MPELPEVEQAARVLRTAALGKSVRNLRVLHCAQRRHLPPRAIARVRGARIVGVDRRGKHQLLSLSTGDTLVVHFRMTGDWLVDDVVAPVAKYVRVAIELDDGVRISLVDPRALSTVTLHRDGSTVLPALGPDPTDPNLSVECSVTRCRAGAYRSKSHCSTSACSPVSGTFTRPRRLARANRPAGDRIVVASGSSGASARGHPIRPGQGTTPIRGPLSRGRWRPVRGVRPGRVAVLPLRHGDSANRPGRALHVLLSALPAPLGTRRHGGQSIASRMAPLM